MSLCWKKICFWFGNGRETQHSIHISEFIFLRLFLHWRRVRSEEMIESVSFSLVWIFSHWNWYFFTGLMIQKLPYYLKYPKYLFSSRYFCSWYYYKQCPIFFVDVIVIIIKICESRGALVNLTSKSYQSVSQSQRKRNIISKYQHMSAKRKVFWDIESKFLKAKSFLRYRF